MDICKSVGKVDKKLLPVKAHYFLFLTALACALPFRTVFAKQLGISATAVGVIFCAAPFLRIVSNPLCGFILDYFKRFRLTISVIMILVAFSHVAMVSIPPRTVMMHNRTNFVIFHFHSKLEYSCINDSFSSSDSLVIFSNYTELANSSETSSFTCKMECSDSSNGTLVESEKNMQQCKGHLNFELTALVKIANCDMYFNLTSGKLLRIYDGAIYSDINRVNQSSVIYQKSWKSFSDQNCSNVNQKPFGTFNVFQNDEEMNGKSDRTSEETNNLADFIDAGRYMSKVPLLLDEENKKRYYVLQKYKIESENKDWYRNCPCKLKINCLTKQCVSNSSKDEIKSLEVSSYHTETGGNEYWSVQFWSMFLLISLSSQSLSAVMFMTDTVCYEILKDRQGKYGQQRLWGTVGWGVGALAGGYLNQVLSPGSGEIDYAPSFYLLAVIILIDLIPVYQFKVTDLKFSSHIWKDVCFLLSKSDILCNIIIVYSIGVLSGLIWNYQFWFMEEIGASQVLLGLSQTFECIFELPWFVVSGWIINKIGHGNCNSITIFFFGLRYLCFAFMYDPWMTLPVGILHGPTFGLFYASLTMYAKEKAPPGTEGTVQSLLHLSFEGTGVATGIILGGVGLDYFGSRMTFMYAAEISFLLLIGNVLMNIMFTRSERRTKQTKAPAVSS